MPSLKFFKCLLLLQVTYVRAFGDYWAKVDFGPKFLRRHCSIKYYWIEFGGASVRPGRAAFQALPSHTSPSRTTTTSRFDNQSPQKVARDVKLLPKYVRGELVIHHTIRKKINERIMAATVSLKKIESEPHYSQDLIKASKFLNKTSTEADIHLIVEGVLQKTSENIAALHFLANINNVKNANPKKI
ncbi:unnamed protein product [Vicia faba]|uniref:Uncharacterized protein n=1 Tax=Vicia faba TaxID=3906 RepID=A0AAV1AML0_VICFA|nr:unnamed protein product [Vicia faba]